MKLTNNVQQTVQNKALFNLNYFHMFTSIEKLQLVQRGCGVSILTDIQNPKGHSPGHTSLSDPALNRELKLGVLQRCLPASTAL